MPIYDAEGNEIKIQPRCFMCGNPCAGWCRQEDKYYCANHDPICDESMRAILKSVEGWLLMEYAFPCDMTKIN